MSYLQLFLTLSNTFFIATLLYSFDGETRIKKNSTHYVKITELKEGDVIQSYDFSTGRPTAKKIISISTTVTTVLYSLYIKGHRTIVAGGNNAGLYSIANFEQLRSITHAHQLKTILNEFKEIDVIQERPATQTVYSIILEDNAPFCVTETHDFIAHTQVEKK